MPTLELTLYVDDRLQEFLIAELLDLDVEGFVQQDDRLVAYVEGRNWNDVRREHIERWLAAHGQHTAIEETTVSDRNWNEAWEETIRPLAVGPFLIRPTWAATPPEHAGKIVLEIDPKMSFGTGYHESTRLVLRALPGLISEGARVLDAGSGTGILAIAALKLGAAHAVAFDIDPWAQTNAVENFHLNGVAAQATFYEGSLEIVEDDGFDLVLANINRNALAEMLPGLAARARPGARLVLAGLLRTDADAMREAARAAGLRVESEAAENEWWSVVLVRPAEAT